MKFDQKFQQLQHSGQSKKLMDKFTSNIDQLLAGHSANISYQLAYDNVYKLTKDHKQTELLNTLEQKLNSFLAGQFATLEQNCESIVLLKVLQQAGDIITKMGQICLFLDINYCKKELNSPLRKRLGDAMFKTLCGQQKVLTIAARSVFAARDGEKSGCLALLAFIAAMDDKQQFFEKYMLGQYEPLLRKHFESLAKQEWERLSLPEYLVWCKNELQREISFGKEILVRKKGLDGIQKIQNAIYQTIVLAYKPKIYETDEEQLFQRLTLPILELFRFGRNKEVQGHIQWFMTRVEARLNIIPTTENASFLSSFCDLYHKVAALLKDTHGKFEINYRAVFTFEEWINNEKFNVPLRLNLLLDTHLRSGQRGKPIGSVILVFKLVKEKNLFENLYRRMLLERFVHYYSNYKLEEQMRIIELMETQCGDEWTKKIKSICQLFAKNRDTFANDKVYSSAFKPVIVQENDWPYEHKQTKIALHHQLTDLTAPFEKHYLPTNKNHRLLWSPRVGTVTLSIKFAKTERLVLVSIDAANLLLNIQKRPQPLSSYLCQTGYKLDEVEPAIQTLVASKLLISSTKDSDVVLELTNEYPSGGVVDLVSNSDKGEIQVKAMEELKADRKLMVEAIIVKIMKSEKMSKRQELVQKTAPLLAQRGFNFNADFVQKSIDRLLDKEFLRDFEDGSLGYIA